MKKTKLLTGIKWVASIILLVVLIALLQGITGDRKFFTDFGSITLYIGLLLGLSIAYKWELLGGAIATLGIILSGFLHPLVIPPGILYIAYWFMSDRKMNMNKN